MTYLKDNRTVRFEEIESDRAREESDVRENSPLLENHSNTGNFFSSATRYHSDAMLHFEAGNLQKTRARTEAAQKELTHEIIEVTSAIREAFSEFYNVLSETPLFIARQNKAISTADFEQYLESLKTQLAVFEELQAKV